jgi:hypothetical protein
MFVNDAQRRAVFSRLGCGGFSNVNMFARDPVKSFEKKITPLLKENIDADTIDWYAEYDSSLSERENIVNMVKRLRERELLKGLSERADYDPKADIQHVVNDIVAGGKTTEDALSVFGDDKWAMSQFRNEMLRAVHSGMLRDDNINVMELGAVDDIFNRYLNKIRDVRRSDIRDVIRRDSFDIKEAGYIPVSYDYNVGKGTEIEFVPYSYEMGV